MRQGVESQKGETAASEKPRDLGERTVRYSLRVIQLFRELVRDPAGRIVGQQLLRAATSVGANVHEAKAGQSKRDFIAKMSVAHKEAREAAYWLRLVREGGFVAAHRIEDLVDETDQLVRILVAVLVKAKKPPVD
jgi:four helix bundle protein